MQNRMPPRGITRRKLLQGTAAIGAAGLILPASMQMAQAAPQQGGVFRVGIGHGSSTDGYDPGLWDQLHSQVFAAARHNQLIEIDADGSLIPEIAESWESADGSTWVFKIRDGVSFHSGKTLTAEDVVASINHVNGGVTTCQWGGAKVGHLVARLGA